MMVHQMAIYSAQSATGFDNRNLWISNGGQSSGEAFAGQTSASGSILSGHAVATYSEYTFTSNGLTYRYIGSFEAEFSGGLLSGSVSASGTYNRIVVMDGNDVVADYSGKSTAVDFGSVPTGVLGTVSNLLGLVGGLLSGPGAQSVPNLHLDATPTLPATAFSGNDTLTGSRGADKLYGFAGNDLFHSSLGADTIDGGTGVNTVSYLASNTKVRVVLETGEASYGHAQGDVLSNIQNLRGSAFHDVLAGDAGKNELRGEGGADRLLGKDGNDLLVGGDGDDILTGGNGADSLYGQAGADTFDFDSIVESGGRIRDTIRDFSSLEGDKVDLVDIDRNDVLSFIGTDRFSGAGGEVRFQKSLHDVIVSVDLDGDRRADFSVKLAGVDSVSASDFLL
jgi:Ca2+-binding RTX toxin-like protein